MAYSELVKNFESVRDYMRQFYIYGFKSREEYDAKSPRSYDNERRRAESWLGDYMSFQRGAGGKSVFLSVDSRTIPANPLYRAFKAKSFTPGDITFHFYILDLLADGSARTVKDVMEAFAERYFQRFAPGAELDESTVRKKLREYEALGLLVSEKRGRERLYRRAADTVELAGWREAAAFFSEAHPLGVIGSFLLDKYDAVPDYFGFKHHYIFGALDSEVLCAILMAMQEKRRMSLTLKPVRGSLERRCEVLPWRVMVSTQTGRQYLLCWQYSTGRPRFLRLDDLRGAKMGERERRAAHLGALCEGHRQKCWGVSDRGGQDTQHLEMTVRAQDGESYIVDRLLREKRCGRVERLGPDTWRFAADVYDPGEMLPWLRTFIGRVETLTCTAPDVVHRFYADLDAMRALYGGDGNAVS